VERVAQPLVPERAQCTRNKRDRHAGQEKRMRKLPTELSAQWHQIGGWLHNTPMFIDPSSIRVSSICFRVCPDMHVHARKCLYTWSQQPNVTPNLRQRMQHHSMRFKRRKRIRSRILFDRRATANRANDNPWGRRSRRSSRRGGRRMARNKEKGNYTSLLSIRWCLSENWKQLALI